MLLASAPAQLVLPWANGDGTKTNPIPVPSQTGITPGAASWTDGFPPLCATPVTSGGLPPTKADMNGGLFQMSGVDVWMCAGGGFPWSSAFSTAVGGYPKGARVLGASGFGYWLSILDNNTSDPYTGGAGWIPQGGVVSSVYANEQNNLSNPGGKILFDTVEFDPFSMWNAGSQYFIAPWAGTYRLSGSVYITLTAGSAVPTGVEIYHNGSLAKFCSQMALASSAVVVLGFDAVISCAAADQLYPQLFLGTTGTVAVGANSGSNETNVYAQLEYTGPNNL